MKSSLKAIFSTSFSLIKVAVLIVWIVMYWTLYLKLYLRLKIGVESCKFREALEDVGLPGVLQARIVAMYRDEVLEGIKYLEKYTSPSRILNYLKKRD